MRYARIFIMLIIAFGINISGLKAEDQIPSPQEKTMLDMINHARAEKGLQPLSFDERLYVSASSHSLDMIEKNYYSSTSPDGKTFQERMLENRYIPVISGEALGMLSFRNFVNSDNAVKAISENMLADESDAERKQPLRLLNPDVRDIGISFRAGVFERNGVSENVYVVVCDVGNNDTKPLESALIDMINEIRQEKHLPLLLNKNEKLCEAAKNQNQDMLKYLYFSNISSGSTTPFDRVTSSGYKAIYVYEVIGAIGFDHFEEPMDAISLFFEHIVKNEPDTYSSYKGVFEREATDIGMDFDILFLNVNKENPLKIYFITVEIAFDQSIFSGRGRLFEADKFYIFQGKTL